MSQVDDIYQTLRNEIISGSLREDTPLRENDLAKRFNVSRTPIREVLHRLSSEKLVRTVPNSGAFVGAFSWEDAREIFSIRQVLEAFAAGLACIRINQQAINQFEEIYSRMLDCQKTDDIHEYSKQDEDFHELINQLSGNKHLIEEIQLLNDRVRLTGLRKDLYRQGRIRESLDGHRKIIDAFIDHDQNRVASLMLNHGQEIFGDITQAHITSIFNKQEE